MKNKYSKNYFKVGEKVKYMRYNLIILEIMNNTLMVVDENFYENNSDYDFYSFIVYKGTVEKIIIKS